MTEIEVKILEINRAEVEKKLTTLGAKKVGQELMEAVVYFPDQENSYVVRIRKEQGKVVLTVKQPIKGKGAKFMDETEVEVGDFDQARRIIGFLGRQETVHYKKRRITYQLGQVEVVIDKYLDELDFVPEYLEIEAPSVEQIYKMVEKLGFKKKDCLSLDFSGLLEYYSKK